MKKSLRLLVAVSASSLAISALASGPVGAGEQAPGSSSGESRAAKLVQLRAGGAQGAPSYVGPARTGTTQRAARAATFQVTYNGFTPAARTAFQSAVSAWASRVTSTVPITVNATFQPLGPGILGSAGPNFVHRDFAGAPQRNTWYVDAIANKRAGRQMHSAPDITANFSSSFSNWYFGTDGATPAGKYDFKTVVLHELGHGLGFIGAGNVSGGRGTVRCCNPARPISYDRFTENLAGTALLNFPDNSTQLSGQLRSNNVYFDSAAVRQANGNLRARLYAPATWQGGSSYSHLNEATYPKGNAHSLMTPFLSTAEAIHFPGPLTLGLFKSIGW